MIEEFFKLIEGQFENKIQAFSNPSKYAFIRVTHINLGDGLIYGEQAYNYEVHKPYRQFVLEPVELNGKIQILNYEILNKENYAGGVRLEEINKDILKLKPGCDVIMNYHDNHFQGGITGCDCMVNWGDQKTYLQNQILLTATRYCVLDKGFSVETKEQIWGSKYDRFEFVRRN